MFLVLCMMHLVVVPLRSFLRRKKEILPSGPSLMPPITSPLNMGRLFMKTCDKGFFRGGLFDFYFFRF